jgi:hypothetical protein
MSWLSRSNSLLIGSLFSIDTSWSESLFGWLDEEENRVKIKSKNIFFLKKLYTKCDPVLFIKIS